MTTHPVGASPLLAAAAGSFTRHCCCSVSVNVTLVEKAKKGSVLLREQLCPSGPPRGPWGPQTALSTACLALAASLNPACSTIAFTFKILIINREETLNFHLKIRKN